MKIKIFKTYGGFKKRDFHINPSTSWKFILCMIFVLLFGSMAFGFLLFRQVSEKSAVTALDANKQTGTVEKEKIKKVLEYFSERERKSAEIINSPSNVVDPSM